MLEPRHQLIAEGSGTYRREDADNLTSGMKSVEPSGDDAGGGRRAEGGDRFPALFVCFYLNPCNSGNMEQSLFVVFSVGRHDRVV